MQLVVASAVLLAMCGALFGAGMARLLWAENLTQAQQIDAIRNESENHLRRTIAALERTVDALQEQVSILQKQQH